MHLKDVKYDGDYRGKSFVYLLERDYLQYFKYSIPSVYV